jgi:tetratricopeptide (TPR) repeat protein
MDAAPSTSSEAAAGKGAPALRVPPSRPVAVILLALILTGAVGFRLSRVGTPDPAPESADEAATAPRRPAADPAAALDARIADLETRVAADPGDARSLHRLGLSYHDKGLRTGDQGLTAKAADILARADELRPGDPGILTGRGIVAASRHDFATARAFVLPVVAADPYAADARAVLADANIELGLYDEAARVLDELTGTRPGLAGLSRLSYLQELQGDLDTALVTMRQAAATDPRDPWDQATLHTFTGDLLLLKGKAPQALAEFDRALAAKPDLSGAVSSRAAALVALNRYDEAVSSLEAFLRGRADVATASMLTELRALKGRASPELDAMVDRILTAETAAGYDNLYERADVALGRGDLASATTLAEQAYARRPDNVFAAEVLGYVRLANGDVAGAAALVGPSTRLDSADLHQHLRAAEILRAAGDDPAARAQLSRAFELAPYPAPALVAGARNLAGTLGVAIPDTWRPPV